MLITEEEVQRNTRAEKEKNLTNLIKMVPAALFSGQEQFMAFSFQVKAVLDEIIQQLPDPFNMEEMMGKAKEKTPYTVVALQECERMNILTNEMRRSLKELDLGLQVHSTRCLGHLPALHSPLCCLCCSSHPPSWARCTGQPRPCAP